ncbi:type II toxin-antitoxin system RelE/ParE family toxin [Neorhizobium lilium]|uniref:Type II toxin-antitoxin system RelE/ParE family toxin n=1 Tax=Neorhizobium lilium TaxID=2503024 RepID=A0A3S3SBE0_9HYPH|nr:type II toxin-antitoxin system RelE/ParE family toxin [Neorhizobium lilium]RWX76016.1 type II toxin-antitoxin system RelE/ParE family toxin [Neorhizobium lilium]
MKVLISEEAIRYIQRERTYLGHFSRRASIAFSQQLKRGVRLIGEHPRIGTVVAPVEGVRRFVSAPYHLDYVIKPDHVLIVSVLHARQGPADLEKDEDGSFE